MQDFKGVGFQCRLGSRCSDLILTINLEGVGSNCTLSSVVARKQNLQFMDLRIAWQGKTFSKKLLQEEKLTTCSH